MKKIFILLFIFTPSFIFGSECDCTLDSREDILVVRHKDFLQAGFIRMNLSDLPDYLTKFFPHYDGGSPDGSNTYLYKKDKLDTYGYIYISTMYCGTDNGLFINCPDKKYSIQFITDQIKVIGSASFAEMSNFHLEGALGFFLNPNEYDKIKKIYPNIEDVLNKQNNIILPVKISMNNIYYCYSTPMYGMFSISDITLLSGNESYIKATYNSLCNEGANLPKSFISSLGSSVKAYCLNYPNKIYIRTDDSYVNMRKKPDSSSNIIAKILPNFPRSDKYITRAYCSLMKCNHDGGDKEINKIDDTVYWDELLFPFHTSTLDWQTKILNYAQMNKNVKYIFERGRLSGTYYINDKMVGDMIYLYTEGLPIDGWYKVFYIRADDKFDDKIDRVYGYIHKSQLSWGY